MPAFKGHTTGTTDTAWNGPEQKTKVKSGEARSYYGKIFAWYDEKADEGNKSDYKFIHHEVSADGTPGDANTNGCSAGIGILNGGRTGTVIPQADYQGVYDHLAKHIRDAGKEPPDLKNEENAPQVHGVLNVQQLMMHAQSEVWAILPDFLRAALANLTAESIVERRSDADLQAMTRPGPKTGGVARVPIFGTITHRDSLWSSLFGGGATVERLTKTLRDLGSDPAVSTVLLDIDSPGGTVSGVPELAAEVRALREKKHVVALANSLTASAAYWLASQADEIVATPEALVGSIGVFTVHEDYSAMMDKVGVKTTYISAGKYKTEANPDQPLSDVARAHLQSIVDDAYALFVGDVARGRGVTAATVREKYGQGRVMTAGDAKAAGMIDRVALSDETMRRLAGARAEDEIPRFARNDTEGERLALLRRRLDLAEKI